MTEKYISLDDVMTIIARKHLFKDKTDFDKCVHAIAEQIKALPTVEAVPLSVIEKITETMEAEYASADELADWFSGGDKTEASYYRGKANGIKLVKGIIDKAVKEIKQ